jgi:hypothetical protein
MQTHEDVSTKAVVRTMVFALVVMCFLLGIAHLTLPSDTYARTVPLQAHLVRTRGLHLPLRSAADLDESPVETFHGVALDNPTIMDDDDETIPEAVFTKIVQAEIRGDIEDGDYVENDNEAAFAEIRLHTTADKAPPSTTTTSSSSTTTATTKAPARSAGSARPAAASISAKRGHIGAHGARGRRPPAERPSATPAAPKASMDTTKGTPKQASASSSSSSSTTTTTTTKTSTTTVLPKTDQTPKSGAGNDALGIPSRVGQMAQPQVLRRAPVRIKLGKALVCFPAPHNS